MIPADFRQLVTTIWGLEGQRWLAQLPTLIDELAHRWQLVIEPPFAPLSYNFAAPGRTASGQPIVLKIGLPRSEITREIAALRFYNGRGICHIHHHDATKGAMVLERLLPGTLLAAEPDDDLATKAAAQAVRALWRPLTADNVVGAPFRHVRDWAAGLGRLRKMFMGGTGPFPADLVDLAERLFAELLASAGPDMLLHGDCHHFNILKGRDGQWLAIDPKGMIGEPAFEPYALLKNPSPAIYHAPNLKRLLNRRLDILAHELGQDRERLRKWGLAMAVLSGWWSYEDEGQGWEGAFKVAETLREG